MSNPTHKMLSKYQRVMLTHMGIVPWHLKSNEQSANDTAGNLSTESDIPQSGVLPPTQDQKQAGLDRLRQKIEPKVKSVSQCILLCMPENAARTTLMQDIILFSNLPLSDCLFEQNANPNDYRDFKMAWKIGEPIALNGLVLTAPAPDKITSSKDKKQLWHILQQIF